MPASATTAASRSLGENADRRCPWAGVRNERMRARIVIGRAMRQVSCAGDEGQTFSSAWALHATPPATARTRRSAGTGLALGLRVHLLRSLDVEEEGRLQGAGQLGVARHQCAFLEVPEGEHVVVDRTDDDDVVV